MAEKVDAITLEIEATTEKADKGIDKTIESLRTLKTALNGINTKKLKQEMESFEDFQKKLQTVFSGIKISGNMEELRKQIAQAEARFDTLLNKENKLKTVSGINENSKQYRNLQYDIAEVCNSLDQLYAAMDKANAQKPLNFWEKPNWSENLQKYGTTDESVIKSSLGTSEDIEKVESVATYAANNIKQSFSEVAQTEEETAQKVKNLGGKMQGFAKNVIHGFRDGINSFYRDCEDAVKSWASKVTDWFKEKLDINSPSKVFEQFGLYTVQGFNKGINNAGKTTKKAVSGWLAPLDNVAVNTRLSINDTDLRACRANYGEDFSRDISVQRYTHNIMSGSVQAAITADNPITAAFKEIAEAVIVPAIQGVEVQAKRQADKNEQTIVEIGGKTITDAVREQKSRNGFSFQPT